MCLCFVDDAARQDCEGEAFRVMRLGEDGFLRNIYFPKSDLFSIGQTREADSLGAMIRAEDNQTYLVGFHCWLDVIVAAAMREMEYRSYYAAYMAHKAMNFNPLGVDIGDLRKDDYVVVRVSYRSRLALGRDNPLSRDSNYQYPCIVLGKMTFEEIVTDLPTEDLPVVWPTFWPPNNATSSTPFDKQTLADLKKFAVYDSVKTKE